MKQATKRRLDTIIRYVLATVRDGQIDPEFDFVVNVAAWVEHGCQIAGLRVSSSELLERVEYFVDAEPDAERMPSVH